jgi:hypothetical protein
LFYASKLEGTVRVKFGIAHSLQVLVDFTLLLCFHFLKYPFIKIFQNGVQIASYSQDRNMFAVTPIGAELFLKEAKYLVNIDDFTPKGDVMGVGIVKADDRIRIGDEVIVSETEPSSCTKCKTGTLRQETDVLDTWFSSGLWPFSTMGWPENTATLKAVLPDRCPDHEP